MAILVSGAGSNMEALLKASSTGHLTGVQAALVIASRPGIEAVERAGKYSVPCITADRKNSADDDGYSLELLQILKKNRIEVICLAGFLHKIEKAILDEYSGKILNIHPSLLPKYGGIGMYGMNVHRKVIDSGDKTSGCTVHIVGPEYDTGKIIIQKKVPVFDGDSPDTLAARILEEEHRIYPEALNLLFPD